MEQSYFIISFISDASCAIKKYFGTDEFAEVPQVVEKYGRCGK